jgi:acetyl-CoA synthetase
MRRILRKIAEDDLSNLGDTSTLADPAVVDDLVEHRASKKGDDEVVVSGHRLSCAKLEATLKSHNAVAQVAVIGVPDPAKGEALWAFIEPDPAIMASDVLGAELKGFMRREIGEQAAPAHVIFGPLPKTPSGEVVRPVLRRIAETGQAGDVSGLADRDVATHLAKLRADALS